MIIDLYLYIFVLFSWLIYILNSSYQNYKMKHLLPNKKIELLTIPFYVFYIVSICLLIEKIAHIVTTNNNGEISGYDVFPKILISVGVIFCLFSILLYTYISLFVKSFPSCLAIKNGQHLKGIYNYIRHPSYYIFLFITFGNTFCLLNLTLFTLACINHISLYFYYMIEENQIKKTNPYYGEYLKKTKRFFPNFTK